MGKGVIYIYNINPKHIPKSSPFLIGTLEKDIEQNRHTHTRAKHQNEQNERRAERILAVGPQHVGVDVVVDVVEHHPQDDHFSAQNDDDDD